MVLVGHGHLYLIVLHLFDNIDFHAIALYYYVY